MDRSGLIFINMILAIYLMIITTVTATGGMYFFAWVFASGIVVILGLSLQIMCLYYCDFKVTVNGCEVLDLKEHGKAFFDTILEIKEENDTMAVCRECMKPIEEETE
jgi:hypothetical protein